MSKPLSPEGVPDYLFSTHKMIADAFPSGVSANEYVALLKVLYAEMSDGNLALVVSVLARKDTAEVFNDVLAVGSTPDTPGHLSPKQEDVDSVTRALVAHGYLEWLDED